MPAAANQQPATNQAGTLDTARVTSNIPKAGTDDGAWVYPSPQMVENVLPYYLTVLSLPHIYDKLVEIDV